MLSPDDGVILHDVIIVQELHRLGCHVHEEAVAVAAEGLQGAEALELGGVGLAVVGQEGGELK